MMPHTCQVFSVPLCLLCVLCGVAGAEEPKSAEGTVRKTYGGHRFQVPADWPIEERNGLVGPIPIEEYLGRKFQTLEARLQMLDQQLTGLDVRLRVLEEQAKQAQRPLQSSSSASR